MKNATRFIALFAFALIALAEGTATATEGVSPGAIDHLAGVETRCPTFSWGENDGTAVYELVAYVLPEDSSQEAELTADSEVLYARVAGSATSWTPSAGQCFASGGRYVWFVRAVTELVDDQIIEAGEWSAGRYFSVPAGPSAEDVARAVEVLKQWEAANGGGSLLLSSAAVPVSVAVAAPDADSGTGSSHRKSVPTAAAAIRGEHPGMSGEVYGVVGTSASADGAGVAAVNLGGGPDLVLDGSADGDVDTLIYENTVIRSSSDDQVFLFHNGGGGALDLHVHGSLNGDGLNVQYGPVIDDSGNWLGVGDTIPCVGCVASADIADGSVATTDLVNDSVTGAKIADGAVGASALRNNAVTTEKIADSTITAADVATDGGLYSTRGALYRRTNGATVNAGQSYSLASSCNDQNDLPIQGGCEYPGGSPSVHLQNAYPVDWGEPGMNPFFFCDFVNNGVDSEDIFAYLVCVDVPGF